jgi:hypothetical protein
MAIDGCGRIYQRQGDKINQLSAYEEMLAAGKIKWM